MNASILSGVRIGAHAIFGGGAVVPHNVPQYSIVAGVPARVLRSLRKEQLFGKGLMRNDAPQRGKPAFGTISRVRVAVAGCGYWGPEPDPHFAQSRMLMLSPPITSTWIALARTKSRTPPFSQEVSRIEKQKSCARAHKLILSGGRE